MRISDWSSDVCSSDLGWTMAAKAAIATTCRTMSISTRPHRRAVGSRADRGEDECFRQDGSHRNGRGVRRRGGAGRSEARRGGKEGVSTVRSRWVPCHEKKKELEKEV